MYVDPYILGGSVLVLLGIILFQYMNLNDSGNIINILKSKASHEDAEELMDTISQLKNKLISDRQESEEMLNLLNNCIEELYSKIIDDNQVDKSDVIQAIIKSIENNRFQKHQLEAKKTLLEDDFEFRDGWR